MKMIDTFITQGPGDIITTLANNQGANIIDGSTLGRPNDMLAVKKIEEFIGVRHQVATDYINEQ